MKKYIILLLLLILSITVSAQMSEFYKRKISESFQLTSGSGDRLTVKVTDSITGGLWMQTTRNIAYGISLRYAISQGWLVATGSGGGGSSQWTTEADGIYYNGKVGVGISDVIDTDSSFQATSASFTMGLKTGYDIVVNDVTIGMGNKKDETNLAIGKSAMAATTGIANTAIGFRAMFNNTSGDRNLAVGSSALFTNITGVRNTAIGSGAALLGTGSFNTIIGESAARSSSTASNNSITGYRSLYTNTTGSSNTSNGAQTLYSTTTGYSNTALGIKALYANTTGHNNIALGDSAGYLYTTANNFMFLGCIDSIGTNYQGAGNIGGGIFFDRTASKKWGRWNGTMLISNIPTSVSSPTYALGTEADGLVRKYTWPTGGIDTTEVVLFNDTISGQKIATKYELRNFMEDVTDNEGDMIYRDENNTLNQLPAGTPGQVLTIEEYPGPLYVPAWKDRTIEYQKDIDTVNTTLSGILTATSGLLGTTPDNTANWDASTNLWDYTTWYGFVDNTETTLSFNPTDSTLTLAKTGASFKYIRDGIICTINSNKSLAITGTAGGKGTYYFYFDDNIGTLAVSTTPWTLKDTKVVIAVVKWDKNGPGGYKYFLEDERHGGSGGGMFPRRVHYYMHSTIGTRYQSGCLISGETVLPANASTAANEFKVAEGEIDDEDLDITIAVKGKPTVKANNWVKYYRTTPTTWVWDSTAVPYYYSGNNTYIYWDNAGTMTQGINNRFYNSYLVLTNMRDSARFIIIPGRGQYTSAALAQAEDPRTFDMSGFGINEAVILYRLTWATGNGGAWNTTLGKVKLNNTPQFINQGISSATLAAVANQWTTSGNDIFNTNTGNVAIGAQTPMHKLAIVVNKSGASTIGPLNMTHSDWNKVRTTEPFSSDTSSMMHDFTNGGKPLLTYRDNLGARVIDLDSTKKMSLVKLVADSTISPGGTAWGNCGAALTVYLTRGNTHTITRDASTTITLVGGASGTTYTMLFTHAANANVYTVAFSPQVTWVAAPAFTNTSGAKDIVTIKNIAGTYYGYIGGPFSVLQ